jgi:predicted dehydrogenase
VSNCTPSGLHSDGILAAAAAGKHILSEKPLGITREQMDDAIAATRTAGVKLACVFQRRTSRRNLQLRAMIQEGKFGRILLANLSGKDYRAPAYYESAAWRGTIRHDRGCLMNQGIHLLDLLLWLIGQPVVEVPERGRPGRDERADQRRQHEQRQEAEADPGARGQVEPLEPRAQP